MNRWIALVVSAVVCWAGAMACSGSGMPVAPAPDVDFALNQYSTANEALKKGDLDVAKAEYEKTLAGGVAAGAKSVGKTKSLKDLPSGNLGETLSEYEKTVAGTPNDVKANFGLGLIKLAQLGQGDVATAILDKFGQPPLKTSLVLGPDGYLAKLDLYHQNCQSKPSLNALPFGKLGSLYKNKYSKPLAQAKPELTSADVQKALMDVVPVLQAAIAAWEISAKDPNFSFTLPKELFYSNADVVIKHADLSLGISALYAGLAGIDFANSWTADINLGTLLGPSGKLQATKSGLIATLNKFFNLKADNKLADAKVNLTKALQQAQGALKEYQNGNAGGALLVDAAAKAGVQELLTMTTEVLASFDANTAISTTAPVAHLNLGYFFSTPPDAGKIDIDPFVLEKNNIEVVESFFQKLTDGTIDVSLSQKKFNIFTTAVKGKAFRKAVFANFINLFKDPQYAACKSSTGGGTSPCVPACTGKECGDDGCGGSCGECKDGKFCGGMSKCEMGDIVCVPNCDGKKCGDNGCGGSCGTCAEGSACNATTAQCMSAPTISGISSGIIAAVLANTTKKFKTPISITSTAGLTAVTFECGDGKMEGVPAFDPAANKNKYDFNIQLSGITLSSMCMIKATDSLGQSSQATLSVMIGAGGLFQ